MKNLCVFEISNNTGNLNMYVAYENTSVLLVFKTDSVKNIPHISIMYSEITLEK